MISLEKETYCFIVLRSSRMDPAKRCGCPGIGGLALSAQHCRDWAYAMVFFHCSSQRSQHGNLISGGERDNEVLVGPDNNC